MVIHNPHGTRSVRPVNHKPCENTRKAAPSAASITAASAPIHISQGEMRSRACRSSIGLFIYSSILSGSAAM